MPKDTLRESRAMRGSLNLGRGRPCGPCGLEGGEGKRGVKVGPLGREVGDGSLRGSRNRPELVGTFCFRHSRFEMAADGCRLGVCVCLDGCSSGAPQFQAPSAFLGQSVWSVHILKRLSFRLVGMSTQGISPRSESVSNSENHLFFRVAWRELTAAAHVHPVTLFLVFCFLSQYSSSQLRTIDYL